MYKSRNMHIIINFSEENNYQIFRIFINEVTLKFFYSIDELEFPKKYYHRKWEIICLWLKAVQVNSYHCFN